MRSRVFELLNGQTSAVCVASKTKCILDPPFQTMAALSLGHRRRSTAASLSAGRGMDVNFWHPPRGTNLTEQRRICVSCPLSGGPDQPGARIGRCAADGPGDKCGSAGLLNRVLGERLRRQRRKVDRDLIVGREG